MSSSQYRKKQPASAQQRKDSVTGQIVATKKTQPVKKEAPAIIQSNAPVSIDDRQLREFLLAADVHAQQTFLAQVAICAMKDAQSHALAPLQDLRKQNAAITEHHQQSLLLLAEHQAQHQQLRAENVALQKQLTEQKVSMQKISDQYSALVNKKTESAVKPKTEAIPKKKSTKSEQNAVWIDSKTGLMWSRISIGQVWSNGKATGEAKKLSWKAAGEACALFDLAGFCDWRLPEKNELESLMRRKERTSNAPLRVKRRITDLIGAQFQAGYDTSAQALVSPKENEFGTYWSKNQLSSAEASAVNFDQAQALSKGKRSSLYVRAVRKVA